MRAVLKLFVAVSWVALVPGQANAQSNVPVREAASASAGSIARHTIASWSSAAPVVMGKGWQAASIANDPVTDGIGWGALIGAGTGVGMVALAYARCDGACEAPAAGPTLLLGGGVGAGAGALIGWLVDRAHSSRPPSTRAVSVAPILARRYKAVAVGVRF